MRLIHDSGGILSEGGDTKKFPWNQSLPHGSVLPPNTPTMGKLTQNQYGPEAGSLSKHIGGGVKNVGLVYIDAAGVSRKAIIKSVAKGMVVGKVKGGGDLIVGGGDGGVVTGMPNDWKEKEAAEGRYTDDTYISGGNGAAPPSYSGSAVGDSKGKR